MENERNPPVDGNTAKDKRYAGGTADSWASK